MPFYGIILADDHAMFREAIKALIEGRTGLRVIGEACDGIELLRLLNRLTPDMVIVDITMPNLRGLEAARELKLVRPEVKVLILTMHKNREYLIESIAAGVEGYILKEDGSSVLINAIQTIRQGRVFISPSFPDELPEQFIHSPKTCGRASPMLEPLTSRERQILKLVAEGKSSKEIADLLFISIRTVQHHRASILRKLEIRRTADLVKYAIDRGYTTTNG